MCTCISDEGVTGMMSTLHQSSASERMFSQQLHHIITSVLEPLLASRKFGRVITDTMLMTMDS